MLKRTSFSTLVAPSSALRPIFVGVSAGLFLALAVGCGSSTIDATGGDDTGTPGVDTGLPGDDTGGGDTSGGKCSSDQKVCGGVCTSVKFDPANCGDCGTACKTGEVCTAGKCGSASACTAPNTLCGTSCTNTDIDPNNCGTCGTKCVAGEVCAGAKGCGIACPGTLKVCDKACIDTQNDPNNCGDCAVKCKTGEACSVGKCTSSCPAPNTLCTPTAGGSSVCTNTAFDPNNCGACNVICATGTSCVGGGCGTPDKTDDDGDTISNFHEGKGDGVDTDKDGTADYLDLDSDGDGLTDAAEAGDTSVVTPPVDSDGDGIPDFRDTDSDNDGLSDKDESTKYHTSPTKPDTDGDGYTDAEEVAAGTDPLNPASNPGTISGFSFDLPYKGLPRTQELTFKPQIKKADVGFVTDTTGSMGGTISGIQTSLKSIITKLTAAIPDVAVGVGDHRDLPISPYGSTGDFPFKLWQRVTTNVTDAQTGVGKYVAGGGNDGPEAQVPGLYLAATGNAFTGPGGAVWTPKFDPTVGFDATKGHGTIGGMGFRKDAQPIFVISTDAPEHTLAGDPDNLSPEGVTDNYAVSSFPTGDKPPTVKATVDAIVAIGGKVIGVAVNEPTSGTYNSRPQLEYFALKTGATIPLPAGDTMCATGLAGAKTKTPVDDGTGKKVCPLVFSTTSAGTGIDTAIVDAITKFTTFVTFKTVWLEARDNTATTTIDETKFFTHGIPVSFTVATGSTCPGIATADLLPTAGPDGTFDSFTGVCTGTNVTFALVLQNTTTPATCSDQVFSFKIVVIGDKTVETDSRVVTVRVPGDKTLCH